MEMRHIRNTYQVNYIRGRIANLYLTKLEYDVLNTMEMAVWIKGCLVKANLPHLKLITGKDLVKLAYRYGSSSEDKCIRLRNAYLASNCLLGNLSNT